jgi:hypothetical protein
MIIIIYTLKLFKTIIYVIYIIIYIWTYNETIIFYMKL